MMARLTCSPRLRHRRKAVHWHGPRLPVAHGIITGGVAVGSVERQACSHHSSDRAQILFRDRLQVIGNVSTSSSITATGVLSTILSGTVIDALAMLKSGNIWINMHSGTSLGAFTHGQVVCYAIDFDRIVHGCGLARLATGTITHRLIRRLEYRWTAQWLPGRLLPFANRRDDFDLGAHWSCRPGLPRAGYDRILALRPLHRRAKAAGSTRG